MAWYYVWLLLIIAVLVGIRFGIVIGTQRCEAKIEELEDEINDFYS